MQSGPERARDSGATTSHTTAISPLPTHILVQLPLVAALVVVMITILMVRIVISVRVIVHKNKALKICPVVSTCVYAVSMYKRCVCAISTAERT